MFVCRLDRPWQGTPFPLQGIELTREQDIQAIRDLCRHVYVDARRMVAPAPRPMLTRTNLAALRFKASVRYDNSTTVEQEQPRIQQARENATVMLSRIWEDIASGNELSVELVEQAVRPLVASVLRNADAFFWVDGLRLRDGYSYSHAINCSALAAIFGRHMGFAQETIISLAAGGLLMDVGKSSLPESLLQFGGSLTSQEVDLVRSHVTHGLAIVTGSDITDEDVIDIVRTHHERHDGSGYLHGLSGNDIPLTGRMLGIIDTYDAMTSDRPYRAAISRHHALRQIYAARDSLFQAELVEQFQVCLGVYPTGSLVELSTGEVAIVMAQNHARRLRPRVAILSTPDRKPVTEFRVMNLMDQGKVSAPVEIARTLASGDFSIDNAELFLRQ
jgi:HD-GYP domain-containing protein (c-di-GMP phosphodiesterase class II)